MVTFEEYKKALGARADGLSDADIRARMEKSELLARSLFTMWKMNLSHAAKAKSAEFDKIAI